MNEMMSFSPKYTFFILQSKHLDSMKNMPDVWRLFLKKMLILILLVSQVWN